MTRLVPYGSEIHARNLSMVGKGKAPESLAARMPSPETAAKVGSKGWAPPGRTAYLAAIRGWRISQLVGNVQMTKLIPYGAIERAQCLAMVGKGKTPAGLAARMPSATVAAKVGIDRTDAGSIRRVIRRNAKS